MSNLGTGTPTETTRFDMNLIAGLGLFAAIAIVGIFARPLLPIDETRYLTVAWEMWQSGDYLVPTLNGEIYSHKPPLLFWLVNLTWSITGVSDVAARIIGPIAGLVSIYLTAELGKVLWPEKKEIAGRAALFMGTTGFFLLFASLTMFDAMLTASALLAVLGLVRFFDSGQKKWLLLFSCGLALGVLSKGPVIFLHVLPPAIILPFIGRPGWYKARYQWFLALFIGIIGATVLVSIWLVPALIEGGPVYQEAVLWKQSAGRIANSFAHKRPIYFYLLLVPVLVWPWGWSPYVWSKTRFQALLKNQSGRLCALWVAVVVVLFSLVSGKQPHYMLPVMPAFFLMLSYLFERSKISKLWFVPSLLLPAGVFIGLALVLSGQLPITGAENLVSTSGLIALLSVAGISLVVGIFYKRRDSLLMLIGPVVMFGVYLGATAPLQNLYDSAQIGRVLKQYETAGVAYVGGKYHGEFGFSGRLTKPVDVISGDAKIKEWIQKNPGGVLVGRKRDMTVELPVLQTLPYRNRSYAIWNAPAEIK